jgi:hypothetical protein
MKSSKMARHELYQRASLGSLIFFDAALCRSALGLVAGFED